MDLRLVERDGNYKDVRIGEVKPCKDGEFRAVTLSRTLEEASAILDGNDLASAYLLIFLPVAAPQQFSFSMLNIFVSEGELA